jgi:hypothetical protein
MASAIVIRQISTRDVVRDTITSIIKWVNFLEEYLCQRFILHPGQISKICRNASGFDSPSGQTVLFTLNNFQKVWSLQGGSSYTLVAKGDSKDCQPPLSTIEKGKSPVDVTHILNDLDDEDDKDDVKVFNLVPSSSDASNTLLPDKVDGGEIRLNEEECSQNPSDDDIREQLNEPQGIAPLLDTDKKIKVYQISALQWLLNVCGHSELACFVRNKAFVMR